MSYRNPYPPPVLEYDRSGGTHLSITTHTSFSTTAVLGGFADDSHGDVPPLVGVFKAGRKELEQCSWGYCTPISTGVTLVLLTPRFSLDCLPTSLGCLGLDYTSLQRQTWFATTREPPGNSLAKNI